MSRPVAAEGTIQLSAKEYEEELERLQIELLFMQVPYERLRFDDVTLPPRQERAYVRPPKSDQVAVPARYAVEDRRKS